MCNVLTYNSENNTAVANITLASTKTGEVSARPINPNIIFGAFQKILISALQSRLNACFDKAMKYRDNITAITEYHVEYMQKGIRRHYSFPAAKAMQSAIEKLQHQKYDDFSGMEANQMLKALVWAEDKSDKQGISFAILVDMIVEIMICEPVQRAHDSYAQERQSYETEIESLKSRIKSYESDMNGTVASLNAAQKLVDTQKAEIERLQETINTVRDTCK